MKFAIFAVLIASAIAAVPQARSNLDDVKIVSRSFRNDGNSYNYAFETSDGTKHDETGEVKLIGKESGITMRGSYSFVADDGNTYTVNYIADENGFQPTGAHITSGRK